MNNGSGNVAGDKIAEKAGKLINTRSKFEKIGYPFFTTNRFGEIAPFFVLDNVFGDHRNKLLSSSKVDSYTLKAPLMQDIKMQKALYYVPLQAILPLNWEKWITNPNIGQDCPDDCGTGVKNFWATLYQYVDAEKLAIQTAYSALDPDDPDYNTYLYALFDRAVRFLIICEYFYSDGNLLSQLGICGSKYLSFTDDNQYVSDYLESFSFDRFFDFLFSQLDLDANTSGFIVVDPDNHPFLVLGSSRGTIDKGGLHEYDTLSLREYLDLMRDDPFYFHLAYDQSNLPSSLSLVDFDNAFLTFFSDFTMYSKAVAGDHLDLQRLLAYQLVCHHFYSNDKVDYIYSAELYRQYVGDLISTTLHTVGATDVEFFTQNGINYQYDFLSAKYMKDMIPLIFDYSLGITEVISYFAAIFSYRHSLRYVDYFVASRTHPLAVGNHDMTTDVAVNNNVASVIDITQKLMAQKFLNAVNRVGRKIGDYSHILGGDGMKVDYHNPLWIGQTSDTIYGERSEYTGNVSDAEKNNITSLLKSAGGRYMFDWEIDRPGVAIGVCYYDIERIYTRLSERQTFYLNRFDMFNPYLQYVGDQAIYRSEIGIGGLTPFGYANRHIEYKLRVPRAAGGFVAESGLPSWIFPAERGFRQYEYNQSPKFIQSNSYRTDQIQS